MNIKQLSIHKTNALRSRDMWEGLIRHFHISLYKNAYYYLASAALTTIFNFVFWALVTRLHDPKDVGLWSAAFSASNFISLFSNLGLGIGLIRFLPNSGDNGSKMINTCLSLGGLVSIIASVFFIVSIRIWSPSLSIIRQNLLYSITFFMLSFALTISQIVICVFMAERSNKFLFFSSAINRPLSILLLLFSFLVFKNGFGILLSKCLSIFMLILVHIFVFIPILRPGYSPFPVLNRSILYEIGRYTAGNYISRFFLIMPSSLLPLIVINFLGKEMNAYFYIAWSMFSIFETIPVSISNSLFAEGSNREGLVREHFKWSLKFFFLLMLPVIVIFLLLAGKILLLFGHSYSKQGAVLLRIMAISSLPLGINLIFIAIGRIGKDITGVIKTSIAIAFFTLGLSYLLMRKFGITGVGLGWTFGQMIVAAFAYLVIFRRADFLSEYSRG